MSQEINYHRRRLFGAAAALMIAAGQFVTIGSAGAQSGKTKPDATTIKPGSNTSFGPLTQINAGVLNVGYAEDGRADGPAVILGPETIPQLEEVIKALKVDENVKVVVFDSASDPAGLFA